MKTLHNRWASILSIAVVITNSINVGIIIAWHGIVIPKMLSREINFYITLEQVGLAIICLQFGQLSTIVPLSYMSKILGKRRTLQIGVNVGLIGWIVVFFMRDIYGLYAAMYLLGFWGIFSFMTCIPYIAEISPTKHRGIIMSLLYAFAMTGAILETTLSILISNYALTIVNTSLMLFQEIFQMTLMETPYYFIQREELHSAKIMYETIYGKNTEKEFQKVVVSATKEMTMKSKYIDIVKHNASRRALIFAIILAIFQKMSASIPLTVFSAVLLKPSFISPKQFLLTFFAISAIFTTLSGVLVDRIGRRRLLIISASGSFVCFLSSAIWFFCENHTSVNVTKLNIIPYISFALETAFFAAGVQYIPGTISGEIFTQNVKTKAIAAVALINIVCNMINCCIFIQFVKINLTFINFLLYAIISGISIFYYRKMYDTSQKTLEEIHDHFERHGRRISFPRRSSSIRSEEKHQNVQLAAVKKDQTPIKTSPSPTKGNKVVLIPFSAKVPSEESRGKSPTLASTTAPTAISGKVSPTGSTKLKKNIGN